MIKSEKISSNHRDNLYFLGIIPYLANSTVQINPRNAIINTYLQGRNVRNIH
jgi:hypothetical protein